MHESDWTDRAVEGDGDRLSGAFQRTVGGLEPDLGGLIAGAAHEGRALRRRRRGAALGAVAVVVALAAGAAQLATGGGAHSTVAAGGSAGGSPAPVLPTLNGKPALTGQDLLFAALHAMPQGVEMGGAAGQTTAFTVSGTDTPQLHVEAMATGPSDLLGTQFLALSYDSDLPGYLKQPHGYDETGLAGPDGKLACSNAKPHPGNDEQVHCTTTGVIGSGELYTVTRTSSSNLIVQAVYQLADGSVVSATEDRENPVPGMPGTGSGGRAGQLVPPSLTIDVLTAMVENPEVQAWVTPQFRAAAEATVRPYVDNGAPSCPAGPDGGLTVMPTPRPTSAPASTPYPTTYPVPSGSPQAGATGAAGAKASPSGCPSPSPWHSGSGGGMVTETAPVWPAN
ncbi:hypothetical protein [Kitasatospora viridis]|uniref:Uncharacterized protein n=1 Tax=Kitasatospora viridis TaxID=281105 RepID=A0A561UKX7_9ACTN|nr:hypothetical protein [Kitasatospora viridis]TWG00014.1 hypothetical protein FHX73_113878 [Kitasatospora viridis]